MTNINKIVPQQVLPSASVTPDEVVDQIQLAQPVPDDGQGSDGLNALYGGDETNKLGDTDEQPKGVVHGLEPERLPNYAGDELVLAQLMTDVLPYIKTARDNRRAKVEQDWLRYRDIFNMRRTIAYYEGRTKLFIPALRKAIDVLTRVAKDAIFSDPYLSIETDIPKYKDAALDLMKWLLEDQAKLRDKLAMFLRQLYQLGTSCLKLTWKKQQCMIKYREYDNELQQSVVKSKLEHDYYGPKIDVVDMRHVYVWPETAVDYDGLQLVFEDSTIKVSEVESLVTGAMFDVLAATSAINRRSAALESQRLSEGQTSKEGFSGVSDMPKDVMDITYVWAKFKLPTQQYPQWNQIIILNDNLQDIVRVAENPYWFQRPNYLFGTLFQEHDYFYGHGVIEMLEMWQYMVNDVANHTMDTGTFTLNPIIAYDPGQIDDPDQLELQPMAKWPINPKGIEIIRPPVEMLQNGVNLLQFLMNVIQESSDATALVAGTPRTGLGRATQTATGVSQLFAASNAAIIDQVDTLQSQVLTPLAHYVEIMVHEFLDEAMVIRKLGPDGVALTQRIIRPQDLMLSTDVRWIASNRLREKAAKIQQLVNFFNVAVKIPPQITQQQGFEISFKEIVTDIYSGLGLPNTDRVIRDVTTAIPGILPEFEEELIDAGRSVYASTVDIMEAHQSHIQHHMTVFRPRTELAHVRMTQHLASHYQAIQQLQQQMMMQAQGQARPGPAGKGAPGSAMQVGVGNRPQEQPGGGETDSLKGLLSQLGLG